ncbi:MAG TPA: LysM domain-containing protein [Solirubrobacteraceae bacterium]|jgi:LysM repeat protein
MAHSSPARWLAPLALVAAAVALVVVLSSGLSSSPDTQPASPVPSTRTGDGDRGRTTARPNRTARRQPRPGTSKTYTVQPGDFLSDVADRTGVPVERLRELNPGLDANSMHVGQKIRIAP